MLGDIMHRTTSESGTSFSSAGSPSRMWRFGSAIERIRSRGSPRDDRNGIPHDTSVQDHSAYVRTSDSASVEDPRDSNCRMLQALVQRMRSAPSGPNHVDAAFKEFNKSKDTCTALCRALVQDDFRSARTLSNATDSLSRRDSVESPRSPGAVLDHRSSFSGRSMSDPLHPPALRPSLTTDRYLGAVRDWNNCLEVLAEAHRVSLADTYRSYERDATAEKIEQLFKDRKFRREAVQHMRTLSLTRVLSADAQFFPRYEIRFRNYERVKQELTDIRHLLQSGESGISPSRPVQELAVCAGGDAMLEFANLSADCPADAPVLRFRVSSLMLVETSPIFAYIFMGHTGNLPIHDADDISDLLPPPPTEFICRDGSEVKLYRMPQLEKNRLGSMELLLHAAHNRVNRVPHHISFEQLVAVAECCLRYQCTSPLEYPVEYKWLPHWLSRGAQECMSDGLLIIGYAFGIRSLFTRMSEYAILSLVDEKDLATKTWPQKLKDKIWAARSAKMAQVHGCCSDAIHEYLRPPAGAPGQDVGTVSQPPLQISLGEAGGSPTAGMKLTGSPRCPRKSHSCDAANLGWMMLCFNQMGILPRVVRLSAVLPAEAGPRSLAQLIDMLQRIPSPAFPVHRDGVCDPTRSFRTTIVDVYKSITGLTLYDVSGKSYGWALSKEQMTEPERPIGASHAAVAIAGAANVTVAASIVNKLTDDVCLRILGELEDVNDLHAAAQASWKLYETYKRHEAKLMRKFIRGARRRPATEVEELAADVAELAADETEMKVLASEAETMIRERAAAAAMGLDVEADARTLQSTAGDDYSESGSDDGPLSMREEASSIAPQQTRRRPLGLTVTPDEPPLTPDEVQRILWRGMPEPGPPAVPPPGVESVRVREKFLVGDPCFAEGSERSLLVQLHLGVKDSGSPCVTATAPGPAPPTTSLGRHGQEKRNGWP